MFLDKGFIISLIFNNIISNIVKDRQVSLWLEHHTVIGQFKRTVFKGRKYMYFTAFLSQTGIGNTRPQNRVHFCHIGTPEHEGISMFQVIITTHRFINTETAHKAAHSRGHTVTGIGIQVIGTEAPFNHLGCRITFPDSPLTGTKHTHSSRPFLFQSCLPLLSHNIKGFIPGYFSKVTVFVKFAVLFTQ